MGNRSGMRYAASRYMEFTVQRPAQLQDFLMEALNGISKNKVKNILAGHGVTVDQKNVSQYNFELRPDMVVRISKHKRSNELKNKLVRIVYEDRHLVVVEKGVGIYREEPTMKETIEVLKKCKERLKKTPLTDRGRVFNTEWMNLIELGYTLDCAQTMVYSAINRKESRGSHQRLDGPNGAYTQRDDKKYLKHTLAILNKETGLPDISYSDVKITTFQPAKRVYGAEAEAAEAAKKAKEAAK